MMNALLEQSLFYILILKVTTIYQNWGPGKSTALLSAFRNGFSAFRFPLG
jgi:hypothetical protein